MAIARRFFFGLMLWYAAGGATFARADAIVTIEGAPQTVYDSATDACSPLDVPDIATRAYRDANGGVVVFTLYFVNRALRGPDLDHLHIDCHVALDSPLDADPAHFADRQFLAATWTDDGRTVDALIHEEYHADQHHTCAVATDLGCWYNAITAFKSTDGGFSFAPAQPLVVAAAPFKQTFEQGRHRGFFSPSNIVSDGPYRYFFGSTTGWSGQDFGACLFRTGTPDRSGTWRAFDGRAFSIAYADPYATPPSSPIAWPRSCRVVAPFAFPVNAVVRQRGTGVWVAVFEASRNGAQFPVDGFYYATATDLLHWSTPKLLMAGQTLMSDLCRGGPSVIAYPSILDDHARSRNFEDVGATAFLYFARAKVEGCGTGRRLLLREKIRIDSTR